MLFKLLAFTLLLFVVGGLCLEDSDDKELVQEARADKKKKKQKLRLWGVLLMLVVAKLAITKLASMFFVYGAFQKICLLAGMFINYWMSGPAGVTSPATPPPDYNTISYSYGPPETSYPGGTPPPPGPPSDTSYGVPYNTWPYNKRSLDAN